MNTYPAIYRTLTLAAVLLAASPARAETTQCTAIPWLPYTITTQGIYCFTKHLATNMSSGNAITINTNNVTIDLNGWKLGGLAAGTGTSAIGIYAWKRKNITIRNGTIRGFYRGIWLDGSSPYTTSQGHLVEDIRAEQNTYVGIDVRGRGSIVRRNQVVDTGGSTTYATASAYGIVLTGPGVRALDNDIIGTAATAGGSVAVGWIFIAPTAPWRRATASLIPAAAAPVATSACTSTFPTTCWPPPTASPVRITGFTTSPAPASTWTT